MERTLKEMNLVIGSMRELGIESVEVMWAAATWILVRDDRRPEEVKKVLHDAIDDLPISGPDPRTMRGVNGLRSS